jgi:hypothetical protein
LFDNLAHFLLSFVALWNNFYQRCILDIVHLKQMKIFFFSKNEKNKKRKSKEKSKIERQASTYSCAAHKAVETDRPKGE